MQLFYGSDKIIENPVYNFGNPSNDYGLGFYLTPDQEMARLWASRFKDGGYCISYDLDMSNLNQLVLNDGNPDSVLHWISILVKHRFSKDEYENNKETIDWLTEHYPTDEDAFDIIIGYRADDAYFTYSRDFVNNNLSLEALSRAMTIGSLGLQYVLKSRDSFAKIKLINYEPVQGSDQYLNFRKDALQKYHKIKQDDSINNTFIRDIMRKVK